MRALVLGGGGLKAFWLAGRVQWLAESGYETPDVIIGTSAGALVGSYLSSRLLAGQPFKVAAQELVDFMQKIKQSSDIARKRSVFELALDLYKGRWHGLYDLTPLQSLIGVKNYRVEDLVVVCDLQTHQVASIYMSPSYVLASVCEPILARPVLNSLVDGGLREILPIGQAIDMGAIHITALCTQAPGMGPVKLGPMSLFEQITSTIGCFTSEILDNDLALTLAYNQLVVAGRPAKPHHRLIELIVHRADKHYTATYAKFTKDDVDTMLKDGRWPEK